MKRSLLFIIFITLIFTSTAFSQEHSFYYDEGVRLRETGNFEEAARCWVQGARVLYMRGMVDPRLGIAMIEMVTEQKMEDQYEFASNIYLWGFSRPDLMDHWDAVKEEADRVIPLLPIEKRGEWKELLNKKDISIGAEIRRFWIESDPVQTTAVNERLIEHWQRIDFVRHGIIKNKFSGVVGNGYVVEDYQEDLKKNKYSPYGTDDRGTIYVKYGHPDEMKNQNLFASVPPENLKRDMEMNTPFDVLKHKRYDYYSIWKYEYVFPGRPLIFIFGSPEGTSYQLLDGLDDFIPESAYRGNADGYMGTYNKGIPPGTRLQHDAYRENKDFDQFFMNRYLDILKNMELFRQGKITRFDLRNLKAKYNFEDKNNPDKLYGQQVYSEFDRYVIPIDIIFTRNRILDEENNPKIAVTAMSYIEGQDSISIDFAVDASKKQGYTLFHSLIIRDSLMNEITRNTDSPEELYENTSAFVINHTPDKKHFTIAAAKYDPERSRNVRESIVSGDMPFSGHKTFEVPEPLDSDPGKLELSDLVTGYRVTPELIRKGFPFPVIPGNEIPSGENMQIYLEIYHLMFGGDGRGHYTIEFKVARSGEKGLLARLRGRTDPEQILSQTHTLESRDRTAKESVEFDILELKPGEYEFEVEVTDLVSGRKKTRTGIFRINRRK